jgi:hypothetical protein
VTILHAPINTSASLKDGAGFPIAESRLEGHGPSMVQVAFSPTASREELLKTY